MLQTFEQLRNTEILFKLFVCSMGMCANATELKEALGKLIYLFQK